MQEQILKKLISFKTLSQDQQTNLKTLDWIKQQLSGLPLKFKYLKSNGFNSLYIYTKNVQSPKILLAAHVDVVNGNQKIFKPKVIKGNLYGRGSFDMKYAIASYVQLFLELGKEVSKFDIAMLITTDEELGGKNGSGAFVKKFKPKFCFLPDGGKDWVFQESAKGALQILVKAKGLSGHGSRPWTGKNAIELLSNFLIDLKKILADKSQNTKPTPNRTVNVGSIHAGQEANKIPDYAEAKVDIRFPAPETSKFIKQQIKKLLDKHKNISFGMLSEGQAYQVDKNNYLYKNFLTLTEQHTKQKNSFLSSPGSCDARYFLAAKIPTLLIRPIGGNHHTESEFINLKSYGLFYKILKEFILKNA